MVPSSANSISTIARAIFFFTRGEKNALDTLPTFLFELVHDAAQEFNGRVIAPNTIRTIEGGLLSYGSDFGREHNPYTIGFGRLVDLDQDIDFIGKEALKKIKEDGIKEKLVGLELDGDPLSKAPENFWPVNNLSLIHI